MSSDDHLVQIGPISRREAVQWVLAAMAATALPTNAHAEPRPAKIGPGAIKEGQPAQLLPAGYGTDPKLVKSYKPGELWPLTFSASQKKTATALADVIIPRDHLGPAASEAGVIAMVDEWISAPYPQQQSDRPLILEGLAWMDAESTRRFGKDFATLSTDEQHAICDDICFTARAQPQFKDAAKFFRTFRSLSAAAYYATPAGWSAIGYVGNVALTQFDGPPPEVLDRLGVTQTVK